MDAIWLSEYKAPCATIHIRDGTPHRYLGVSELLRGNTGMTGPAQTPAGAWLQDQDPDGRASLMEDARVLPEYGEAFALLWINEELE